MAVDDRGRPWTKAMFWERRIISVNVLFETGLKLTEMPVSAGIKGVCYYTGQVVSSGLIGANRLDCSCINTAQ